MTTHEFFRTEQKLHIFGFCHWNTWEICKNCKTFQKRQLDTTRKDYLKGFVCDYIILYNYQIKDYI